MQTKIEIDTSTFLLFKQAIDGFEKDLTKIHAAKAGVAVKASQRFLEATIERPQERGSRETKRFTGTLFGPKRRSVKGKAFKEGNKQGFGFPDIRELDRYAKHWRALEVGLPPGRHFIPNGFFVGPNGELVPPTTGAKGDRFFTYRDYKDTVGSRAESKKHGVRQARSQKSLRASMKRPNIVTTRQGSGIRAKNFLRDGFREATANISKDYDKAIEFRYRSWLK